MRVVKRSLNRLVVRRGTLAIEVSDVGLVDQLENKWIVVRASPNNIISTIADTAERAEQLAISMVERAKNPAVHVAVGRQIGHIQSQKVYRLTTSYHWVID